MITIANLKNLNVRELLEVIKQGDKPNRTPGEVMVIKAARRELTRRKMTPTIGGI